jgi:hypothetical protein
MHTNFPVVSTQTFVATSERLSREDTRLKHNHHREGSGKLFCLSHLSSSPFRFASTLLAFATNILKRFSPHTEKHWEIFASLEIARLSSFESRLLNSHESSFRGKLFLFGAFFFNNFSSK